MKNTIKKLSLILAVTISISVTLVQLNLSNITEFNIIKLEIALQK
ncbi:hypothetical protein [Clostridium perfringens]|nr:hypothetical protein [Clostridium perfringens]MDB2049850.1 hypothetical protein [Clostridium perfringens]